MAYISEFIDTQNRETVAKYSKTSIVEKSKFGPLKLMDSSDEVPVFTDTNLGTHIAMAVPSDITAGDFKKQLERAHLNCFPELGEIRVNGLMVKQKSCFYHLPQSLPIKHVFEDSKGTWFLHIEASFWTFPNKSGLSECITADLTDHSSNISSVSNPSEPEDCFTSANKNSTKRKRKKRSTKRFQYLKAILQKTLRTVHLVKKKKRRGIRKTSFLNYQVNEVEKGCFNRNGVTEDKKFGFFASRTECQTRQEWNSSLVVETPSETLSVTGIIEKYFSNYDDVTSDVTSRATRNGNCSLVQVSAMPQSVAKAPPRMVPSLLPTDPSSKTPTNKLKRVEVGKRLVVASNSLGISSSKQKPAVALCQFRDGESLVPGSSSLIRSIVFDVSDNDD